MIRFFQVAFAASSVLASLVSARFDFEDVHSHHAQSLIGGTGSFVVSVVRRPGGRRVWEVEAEAEQRLLEKELGKMTALAREMQTVLNTAQWSPPEWQGLNIAVLMRNQRDFEKALKDIAEAASEEKRKIIRDLAASNIADCPECRAIPPRESGGDSEEEASTVETPTEEVPPEEEVPSVPDDDGTADVPEPTLGPAEEISPEEAEPPENEGTEEAPEQTPSTGTQAPLPPSEEVPPAPADGAPEEPTSQEELPQPTVPEPSPVKGPVTPELTPQEKQRNLHGGDPMPEDGRHAACSAHAGFTALSFFCPDGFYGICFR
ncbi:UNVERIFIED_CONTAM: hypothetical protein HHA_278620 [Hammondia hammondi]|eukprot:XP_008887133.1 hypothetical protein HHA_278620 [Hammondia hammondi]